MIQNFLSPTGFKFLIHRLPNVEFFVQEVVLPGFNLGQTEVPNPFMNYFRHGDKITYDDLVITIRVDENMLAFKEIKDWSIGLTKPESFTQYKNLKESENGLYSDATLIVLNSKGNPKIEILFKEIFPVSISSLRFTSTSSTIDYIPADITFKHNGYTLNIL